MKPLSLTKKPSLTKGQTVLFTTVLEKIKENSAVTFEEAKDMYIKHSCRYVIKGIPHYYNWYRQNIDGSKGGYEPMTEWELRTATVIWLTHNIGSLVLKGYLKVLPVLELE